LETIATSLYTNGQNNDIAGDGHGIHDSILATDYLWYKQDFKNINSIVWRHILSGSGGPTSLQKQSSR